MARVTDLPPNICDVPRRLGVGADFDGSELTMSLTPNPTTLTHGAVRLSAVAFIVDSLPGLVVDRDPDTWTLTTDLSVRMRAMTAPATIRARTDVLRRGGRSVVCSVELTDDTGGRVGEGVAGFMTVARRDGDPFKPAIELRDAPELFDGAALLDEPLLDAAKIDVVDATSGTVRVEVRPELMNTAGTLQGAMVALVAEAATESLLDAATGAGVVVTGMDVRYLDKVGHGHVTTIARRLGDELAAEVRVVAEDTGRILAHVFTSAAPAQ